MKSTVLRLLGRPHNERLENVLQSVAGNGKGKAALLEALLRARARGLGAAAGEVDEDEFVIAGVLDRDGDLEGIEVIVVEDQLAKDPAPIAKGQTNPDGEFCVRFKAKSAPIVRVFARHGRDRWVTPPRRVEKETWVEWSRGGGQPVPRPGTFELREALLNEVVGAAGLKLEELDETPERLQVSLVAETVGLSRGHVALHALCARLEQRHKVPRAALFALLGRTLDDGGWTPPPATTAVDG